MHEKVLNFSHAPLYKYMHKHIRSRGGGGGWGFVRPPPLEYKYAFLKWGFFLNFDC